MAPLQTQGVDDFLDQAFADSYAVLKPGGVLGIVQHEAPADAVDAWAAGDAGYLKRDFVIAQAEAAGFEFEASSEINANPADQPTSADIVWRLAPSLATTEEGTPEREAMAAIGESNRMTLKFRKPAFAADERSAAHGSQATFARCRSALRGATRHAQSRAHPTLPCLRPKDRMGAVLVVPIGT